MQPLPEMADTSTLAGTFGPLESAGPLVVWVVVLGFVFVECAFLVGLFLPGDSLLVTAGVVLAAHDGGTGHVWALAVAATVVAVLGNQVGYRFGRRAGSRVLAREGGRVLNRRNVERASALMHRYGFWAVVAARWIPWVRTLAPMLAGAAHMDARRYTAASVVGAVVWVPTLVLLGHYGAGFLDGVPWLLPAVVGVMTALVVLGTVVGLVRYRKEMHRPRAACAVPAPTLPAPDRG